MKGFRGRRRAAGARPLKTARPAAATRSADAALGRETRGLVGPAKSRSRGRGRTDGGGLLRLRRPSVGRLVTPARAAGLLGMLASGFVLTFVTGPSAFAITRTDIPTLKWAADADVRAALALPSGANVFRVDTAPLEAALEALPAVAAAEVAVRLPDAAVVVTIQEREAILAWEAGQTRFLADREGVIFAAVARGAQLPAGVTIVEDRRRDAAATLAIGSRIDPVDLDVATRLGSVTPADIGSAAARLRVRITEADGFVIFAEKRWNAVFGFYSPATRQTSMIPGQVRLLKSLLDGREDTIARVILASETDGTFVPRTTPKPADD